MSEFIAKIKAEIDSTQAEQKLEETKTYKTSKESVKTYFGDEDFADDDLTM